MKWNNVISEEVIYEKDDDQIIQEAFDNYERLEILAEGIQIIKGDMDNLSKNISEREFNKLSNVLYEMENEMFGLAKALEFNGSLIAESVDRQFRRYGDKFVRQYRCTTGSKSGRMVSSPEKCGIRKDPMKVRQGKKSARTKKSRYRKIAFTKRKSQSKRLSRMNKALRGG